MINNELYYYNVYHHIELKIQEGHWDEGCSPWHPLYACSPPLAICTQFQHPTNVWKLDLHYINCLSVFELIIFKIDKIFNILISYSLSYW